MRKRPLLRRYGIFFVVGAFVEASRLLCFAAILESQSALMANVLSLLFRIVIAFALHATITWRDRPGNFGVKFIKFAINQGVTSGVKTVIFPLWLLILPCPLFALANQILEIFSGIALAEFLSRIITCEFLSVATMDTAVYLTLGFFLHNRISFASPGVSDVADGE